MYHPNRIRDVRKRLGFTQEAIADGMGGGITKGTVAKLETGHMALSLDYIMSIAGVLGVPPAELISEGVSGGREVIVIDLDNVGDLDEAMERATKRVVVPEWLTDKRRPFAIAISNVLGCSGGYALVDPDDCRLRDGELFLIRRADGSAAVFRAVMADARLVPECDEDVAAIGLGQELFVALGRVIGNILTYL